MCRYRDENSKGADRKIGRKLGEDGISKEKLKRCLKDGVVSCGDDTDHQSRKRSFNLWALGWTMRRSLGILPCFNLKNVYTSNW
jgi:hypothetical protein